MFFLFCCIDYEDATPVTNSVTKINEETTTDLRDISDTTVIILSNSIRTTPSNDITAISTTFFSGDEREINSPVESKSDTVTDRFTSDGKYTLLSKINKTKQYFPC